MKSRLRLASLIPAICLLLIAPMALAQTTGTIDGTITDQNGGTMPGVSVELTSPSMQGTRTATTTANGRFRFASLPPGTYKVTASVSGFGTIQKNATVSLDSTATVNMQMALATTAAVTVTGEAPLIDTASTTAGTSYTSKVISQLPVGRNYAEIVKSQPGVQTDSGETQGRSLALSIYGSSSAENLYIIDGVNTTNVIKNLQGKAINQEFIQEVEVKTGGYQAEYGRNTGGVINVITKSGGNEFHGDLFGYFNGTGMQSTPVNVQTARFSQTGDAQLTYKTTRLNRSEGGADIGGFLLKDHIWFFGAYDRTKTITSIQPQSGPVALQNFPDNYTSGLTSAKFTFNFFQGTSVVGSYFADPQVEEGALVVPNGLNSNTYNGRRDTGGTDWAVRATQLFGSFGILQAQYGKHQDRYNKKPQGIDVQQILDVTPTAFGGVQQTLNGAGSVFGPTLNNASNRNDYSGSFTAFVGTNEIKVGGDYQKDVTFGSTYYTGGSRLRIRPCTQTAASNTCNLALAPSYTNSLGQTIPVYYEHDFFTATATDLTPLLRAPFNTPTNRTSLFAQDQVRILPTLTVNAGLRYDKEVVIKGNNITAFELANQWSPRFGFVYDFMGDGSSKAYGSVGRFYFSMPTDLNVRVFTANTQVITFNYSPTSFAQDPASPPGRTRLIQVGSFDGEPVDKGMKEAYQDELTVGVEKALDPTFSVGLKYTYRNLGRAVEDRCDLDYNDPLALGSTCAIQNPGSNGVAASGGIKTCDASANPTDPNHGGVCDLPGAPLGPARRIFRGLEFTARKQFSQSLWIQASYLYSMLTGNYSGAIREGSGQTDPGINADYDYHEFTFKAYGNLELDRPHQFRLDAVYNTPFGLAAGVNFFIRSGVPTSRLGYYNQFYPDLLYLDTRGTAGRLPTDYEANVTLSYNAHIGPVTVTPQLFVFNLLNRQTVNATDQRFNPNASFVTTASSPFYGQGGVEPGKAGPDGTICAQTTPCTDNPDYRKATSRSSSRLLRAAIKISF